MERRQPPQPYPPLVATDEILSLTKHHIETLRKARDDIVRNVTPQDATFENMVRPLINAQHTVEDCSGMIAVLRYASPDIATRKAAEVARGLWNEAFGEFSDRQDIYILLQAVKDRDEPLHPESTRYLEELLADFVRCGHGILTRGGISEYVTRRAAIDELRGEFTKNVRSASGGIWFSEDELDGILDQDFLRFRAAGKTQVDDNITDSRTCFVSLNKHDINTVLQYAKSADTRRRAYITNSSKLPKNLPIFKEVILLRDKSARQLGYTSHAAYRLEKRLAKNTDWVYSFMLDLEETLLPQGAREMAELIALRAAHTSQAKHENGNAHALSAWDYPYYKRLSLEAVFVDQDKIAEYFPIESTISRMLALFSRCLQMRFIKVASPPVWATKVEVWEVWDERIGREQEFIGYLYLDLEFRENKHRGCQNANLQPLSTKQFRAVAIADRLAKSYIDSNGKRNYPSTVLMCNFPSHTPAGSSSCTLLKHSQIVSLFHELGHGIHDLVSRTQYSRFHGWRSPPDYAEALSIMLENLCWLPEELKQLSCHYTTLSPELLREWRIQHPDEPDPPVSIPDSLVNLLIQHRHAFRALYMLGQLADARFDMAVHNPSSQEACAALDPTTLYTSLHEQLNFLSTPPGERGHPHADFTHLLSGYDAGYYSYLSAQVFAADLFAEFKDDPRNQETWERYRSTVLERGASMDELQNLCDFLGRPPDAKALLLSS
ncbi:zincin [Aureobasidium subglaciale]|nr:zincin [Aureobasidium subglaciale]